jgi:hypothetical protein
MDRVEYRTGDVIARLRVPAGAQVILPEGLRDIVDHPARPTAPADDQLVVLP